MEEAPYQQGCYAKENNVQPCGVVPGDCFLHDPCVPLLRDQVKCTESKLHQEGCSRHRRVEGHEEERAHLPTVVLAVDVENGQHNQVRKQEGYDTAKANPAIPEHCRERNIPNGADE